MATWKYAPTSCVVAGVGYVPVRQTIFHPTGLRGSPLKPGIPTLELQTQGHGSRWWEVVSAKINSELRMICDIGDTVCQVRQSWEDVPDDRI